MSQILVIVSCFLFIGCKEKKEAVKSKDFDSYQQVTFDTLKKGKRRYIEYYPGSKTLKIEGFFVDNLRDSIWKYYGEEGQIVDEIEYVNDQKDGMHVHYFSNGGVNYRQEYQKGKMSGIFEVFSPFGFIMQRGRLENGINVGKWEYFSKEGKVNKLVIYDSLNTTIYRKIRLNSQGDTIYNQIKQ